ncbi:MAG: histidine kinase, partial [Ignavibacteria bacterium]|nr:histidine kinase [Ignavibacteria bacterium]
LEDKSGRFWISTNQGLTRFDPKTEIFVNYNTGDGLQSQEFNQNSFLKSSTGNFYFGGINGFNVFNPDEFSESNNPVPVYITSVKVFNKDAELPVGVTEAKEIEFSYNENFFTFEYSALEYYNPAKIEYAYMLEGVDKNWNYVKNVRTAPYTNVSPGDYVFKLKCTNADGVWNKEEKVLKINIVPPWWKKWWFKGGIGILIAGVIVFGINRRLTYLKKWKTAQNEFTKQLIDSHEEERKKISAELHDSLGQDLVIIKNSASMALNNHLSGKDSSNYISQISDISSSALNNVRTISHNLRPVELDRLGLTDTIKSVIEKVSQSADIEFSQDIDNIDGILDKNNEVNFCRIIQESTNNILKHSKASIANVQIKAAGNKITAIIKDNGTGFDPENVKNHSVYKTFGLTGIKERVRMLNGTLKINSEMKKGTEIIISIPVTNKPK